MKEYRLISGFLDRQRRLILTADYLEWENGDLKGREFTRLGKSDIVDFKHGIDWIVWYKFTVGRQYSITFRDTNNKELKIRFDSYFGLRKKENYQKYSNIIDGIWKPYQSHIVDSYVDRFFNGEEVEIQGIKLNRQGIELRGRNGLVPWDKVATKEYHSYFAIYHRDDSKNHSRVSYNEYGTETLWSSIRAILHEKNTNAS